MASISSYFNNNNKQFLYKRSMSASEALNHDPSGIEGGSGASGADNASGTSWISGSDGASDASRSPGSSKYTPDGYGGYTEIIGTVDKLSIDDIMDLFTKGNLTEKEMDKWIESRRYSVKNLSKGKDGNGIIKYEFTYGGKQYSLSCTEKAAASQTDKEVQKTFNARTLDGFDAKTISKYCYAAQSYGNITMYALRPGITDNKGNLITNEVALKNFLRELKQESDSTIVPSDASGASGASKPQQQISGASGSSGYTPAPKIDKESVYKDFISAKMSGSEFYKNSVNMDNVLAILNTDEQLQKMSGRELNFNAVIEAKFNKAVLYNTDYTKANHFSVGNTLKDLATGCVKSLDKEWGCNKLGLGTNTAKQVASQLDTAIFMDKIGEADISNKIKEICSSGKSNEEIANELIRFIKTKTAEFLSEKLGKNVKLNMNDAPVRVVTETKTENPEVVQTGTVTQGGTEDVTETIISFEDFTYFIKNVYPELDDETIQTAYDFSSKYTVSNLSNYKDMNNKELMQVCCELCITLISEANSGFIEPQEYIEKNFDIRVNEYIKQWSTPARDRSVNFTDDDDINEKPVEIPETSVFYNVTNKLREQYGESIDDIYIESFDTKYCRIRIINKNNEEIEYRFTYSQYFDKDIITCEKEILSNYVAPGMTESYNILYDLNGNESVENLVKYPRSIAQYINQSENQTDTLSLAIETFAKTNPDYAINFLSYLYTESQKYGLSKKIEENKYIAYQTLRDLEENDSFNDLKSTILKGIENLGPEYDTLKQRISSEQDAFALAAIANDTINRMNAQEGNSQIPLVPDNNLFTVPNGITDASDPFTASLCALCQDPDTAALIGQSITFDGEKYIVTIQGETFTYTYEELKAAKEQDSIYASVRAFKMALESFANKYGFTNPQTGETIFSLFNFSRTQSSGHGISDLIISLITGASQDDMSDFYHKIDKLNDDTYDDLKNGIDSGEIMGSAIYRWNNPDGYSAYNPLTGEKVNIVEGIEYTIVKMDDKYVYIANPNNTKEVLKIDKSTFIKIFKVQYIDKESLNKSFGYDLSSITKTQMDQTQLNEIQTFISQLTEFVDKNANDYSSQPFIDFARSWVEESKGYDWKNMVKEFTLTYPTKMVIVPDGEVFWGGESYKSFTAWAEATKFKLTAVKFDETETITYAINGDFQDGEYVDLTQIPEVGVISSLDQTDYTDSDGNVWATLRDCIDAHKNGYKRPVDYYQDHPGGCKYLPGIDGAATGNDQTITLPEDTNELPEDTGEIPDENGEVNDVPTNGNNENGSANNNPEGHNGVPTGDETNTPANVTPQDDDKSAVVFTGDKEIDAKIKSGAYIKPDGTFDQEQFDNDCKNSKQNLGGMTGHYDSGTGELIIQDNITHAQIELSIPYNEVKAGKVVSSEVTYQKEADTLVEMKLEFIEGLKILCDLPNEKLVLNENLINERMQYIIDRIQADMRRELVQKHIDGLQLASNIVSRFGGNSEYKLNNAGGIELKLDNSGIVNYMLDMMERDEAQGYNSFQQMLRMSDRLTALSRLSGKTLTDEQVEDEYQKIMSDGYTQSYDWLNPKSYSEIEGAAAYTQTTSNGTNAYQPRVYNQRDLLYEMRETALRKLYKELEANGYYIDTAVYKDYTGSEYIIIQDKNTGKTVHFYLNGNNSDMDLNSRMSRNETYSDYQQLNNYITSTEAKIKRAEFEYYIAAAGESMTTPEEAFNDYTALMQEYYNTAFTSTYENEITLPDNYHVYGLDIESMYNKYN